PHRSRQLSVPGNTLWDPPAYTPPAPCDAKVAAKTATGSANDTAHAFLRDFDTIFVVDDSLSMHGRRWKEAEEAIATITPICTQHDPDGIDLYFLNHHSNLAENHRDGGYVNIISSATVQEIFQSVTPSGATPFGRRLHQILDP